jgi:hypothetical protein
VSQANFRIALLARPDLVERQPELLVVASSGLGAMQPKSHDDGLAEVGLVGAHTVAPVCAMLRRTVTVMTSPFSESRTKARAGGASPDLVMKGGAHATSGPAEEYFDA